MLKECESIQFHLNPSYETTKHLSRFLWVVLQIENICAQKTDSKIRKALRSLPRDLPEAFARSLTIAETTLEPEYQKRLLTLILAAVRPLTMDELREALSVTPFVFTWNPSNLINDIQVVLSAGGSLLIVDEEQFTVHFIHPSVKQILLGDLGPSHNFHIDCFLAGLEMAQVSLTTHPPHPPLLLFFVVIVTIVVPCQKKKALQPKPNSNICTGSNPNVIAIDCPHIPCVQCFR